MRCLICVYTLLISFNLSAQDSLQLETLLGKWHIQYSNFPMWLKGDKINPIFHYQKGERKGCKGLVDKVSFIKKGKEKTINGFDFPLDRSFTRYEWRGNGFMSVLKSRWEIVFLSPDHQWALIYFEKTLFTPEGYDVITRAKTISKDEKLAIENKLKQMEINLVSIPQT